MGTGYHGGFGNTAGSKAVRMSPAYTGDDKDLKTASQWIKPQSGYTDIVIHGSPDNVAIRKGGKWIYINHRTLARMFKGDKEYSQKPIRLISCETGKDINGFAQHLANKLGRKVIAPSDTVWIHPGGRITIGPNSRANSGKWITFYPKKAR